MGESAFRSEVKGDEVTIAMETEEALRLIDFLFTCVCLKRQDRHRCIHLLFSFLFLPPERCDIDQSASHQQTSVQRNEANAEVL